MTYDDIQSYTSHAGVFLHRAAQSMNLIDSIFWDIKVKCADRPYKQDVQRLASAMKDFLDEMKAAKTDYLAIAEELKAYH